jgi:hypothetical protein
MYLRVRDLELLLGGEAEEHLNELDVGFLGRGVVAFRVRACD